MPDGHQRPDVLRGRHGRSRTLRGNQQGGGRPGKVSAKSIRTGRGTDSSARRTQAFRYERGGAEETVSAGHGRVEGD